MNDPNSDPVFPRHDTSGTRVPRQPDERRTLGGTAAMGVLLLAGLLVATAPPMLVAGLLLGLAVGGVVGFAVSRRRSSRPYRFCLPRTGVCVEL